MNWYKYRECHSAGYGQWEYVRIDPETIKDYGTVKAYIKANFSFNDWSEHFRGIEYFKIKHPPRPELKSQIEDAKANTKAYKELTKTLQADLAQIPEADGEVEITIHSMVGQGVYKIWATIHNTKNNQQIYKSRTGRHRTKIKERAIKWCKVRNLDIVKQNSKMESVNHYNSQ